MALPRDELALLRRARTGDRVARCELIEGSLGLVAVAMRRAPALFAYLRGGLDHDDVMQEGAYALCRAADACDPDEGHAWSSFAVQVIVYRWTIVARTLRHPPVLSLHMPVDAHDDGAEDADQLLDRIEGPCDVAGDGDAAALAARGMARLDRQQRSVLAAVFWGASRTEIARALGVTQPTVSRWVARAQAKARRAAGVA